MNPKVIVLVGTDRHPFERLVRWADNFALSGSIDATGILVQHGYSTPPKHAKAVDFLSPDELSQLLSNALVVVTHGGPGTIMDARRARRRPIVVPRDPNLGEHVDDHQQRFAKWVTGRDLGVTASPGNRLTRLVNDELVTQTMVPPAGDIGVKASEFLDGVISRTPATGPVLYIAGLGRSGTTLIERVLGQSAAVVPLGEVVHLWARGLEKQELCGCGVPFGDCAFWVQVGDIAFGGWDNVDLQRLRYLADRVDRQRHIPMSASGLGSSTFIAYCREYARYYSRIYAAASEVSDARVVIDSSKHPSLALVLTYGDVDLRVMHVVRDSMAVSHSWSRAVKRPEARRASDEYMSRYSATRSSAQWWSTNLAVDLLRIRSVPVTRIRYEDFVDNPNMVLKRAWVDLGLPGNAPATPVAGQVSLAKNHTVAGNPMRFKEGLIELRRDDRWRRSMPPSQKCLVNLLTGPLRLRYGYSKGRK